MAKSKSKKIAFGIVATVLAVIICIGAYVIFGVCNAGENKRVYPESQAVAKNESTGKTVIDDTATYQRMNGFGASACWWAQDVGGWENNEKILTYLYDKQNGIGLNIYRYNLGAGSKDDEHILTPNRRTECFLNSDGTYDFTKDANAQNTLKTAKKLAGDDLRVTLFCNSAPQSMTINGAAYGSPSKDENAEWVTNLSSDKYNDFADYCYNCAEYFLNEGYRVTDVSPINEPQFSWQAWYNDDGSYSVNQEGCHYSKTESAAVYNAMIDKFDDSDVDKKGCKISLFESAQADTKGSACAAYIDCILGKSPKYAFKNQKIRKYTNDISLHSYWSSTDTKKETAKYLANNYSNYDIVCTEYCQMTDDENSGVYDLIKKSGDAGTNGMTIEYGVAMANVIMDDLTILNAKEWDWWTACSYGTYTDGLIYLNEKNHNDIQISKRLWCLGNYSKFIDEGAVRIACSSGIDSVNSCAFINKDNSTVVVYVNNSSENKTTTLNATGKCEVYTTDSTHNLEKTAESDAGNVEVSLPAMSVVTAIFK